MSRVGRQILILQLELLSVAMERYWEFPEVLRNAMCLRDGQFPQQLTQNWARFWIAAASIGAHLQVSCRDSEILLTNLRWILRAKNHNVNYVADAIAKPLAGATMYVARIGRKLGEDGSCILRNSKSCTICIDFMQMFGIDKVCYSTDGNYEIVHLRDLATSPRFITRSTLGMHS